MKTLLILRHAKSSWHNNHLPDHERPLNNRGQYDAPRMGKLMKQEDLVPDLIISSTAKRALMTAEAVALAMDYEKGVQITRRFYLAPPEAYIKMLQTLDNQINCVLVVGHNPGVGTLVEQLTGVYERMPTATLAQVALSIIQWSEFLKNTTGCLINVWYPKNLE